MKQRPPFFDPSPSRKLVSRLLGAGAVTAALFSAAGARAQADVAPPPPNLLLLVDTSGSMDYKSASTSFPTCKYSGTSTTGATSERSRWIDLVEVLTGSINDYECQKLDRNGTTFKTEYALGGQPPYDYLYPNPFHRPVNKKCVIGPGTLSATLGAYDAATALKQHEFDSNATCAFQQTPDGVLDAFKDDVRFGLMTFDTEPRGGTDVTGLWSYFIGSAKQGKPEGCPDLQEQEVGVRNPLAPPWEGRAVGFGNPLGDTAALRARNEMVQQVLQATRPYGATPIAGMLADAREYFVSDESLDPVDSSFPFGPKNDKANVCRRSAVILLSDGQPNMDLRPYCEPAGCPYEKAEDIAANLKLRGIEVYVIGFGLASFDLNGSPKTCQSVSGADLTAPGGLCDTNADPNLQACCALNRIAAAGGHAPVNARDVDWRYAHFADNRETLRRELSAAIGGNFPLTSRTASVQALGSSFTLRGADLDFARGFRFAAAFGPGTAGQGWVGSLMRARYQCIEDGGVNVPILQPPNPNEGDDFVANVNKSGPADRVIYTALSTSDLTGSLRPNLPLGDNEGAGTASATFDKYSSTAFAAAVSPDHMKLDDHSCDSAGVSISKAQCRDRVLKWLVGLNNGTGYHRCVTPGDESCSLVGDFMRSAPRAVSGRPSALLVDASYDNFIAAQENAKRPSVLYASSNDGFLHAFKMAPVGKIADNEEMSTRTMATNELWAFVPPAVLPALHGSYPGTHQLLLDGSPAIKDVVATEKTATVGYKFDLQRAQTDAVAGNGTWRTILVQSYGTQRPGYFAIDITDPVPKDGKGPQFLWQLATDETGAQIFGSGGGTPLITTVFLGGFEVAVAVLPGGYGAAPTAGTCVRDTDVDTFTTGYKPRKNVRCYETLSSKLARSLTIVRLDNGKILRTFRRAPAEVPKLRDNGVVTTAFLDAPLTGQPVSFPSEVGAVADRIFIGDQDGALWRVTLAGAPADWKMDLFFDTFPGDGTFVHGKDDGQPIVTPPIISVDTLGNLTVAVSTGDQEALASTPSTVNYVWSLTEKPNSTRTKFDAVPNWHLDFKGPDAGVRVIGTMALFSSYLYFSAMDTPDAAEFGACAQGVGRVYGMHYLSPNGSATSGKGGLVHKDFHDTANTLDYIPAAEILGSDDEAFLGGVSIGQQPTCENTASAENDEYFQYGAHYALGTPTTGKFQLFVSTGNKTPSPTRPGIAAVDQGGSQAASIDLENPAVVTRVDSWAAIVE